MEGLTPTAWSGERNSTLKRPRHTAHANRPKTRETRKKERRNRRATKHSPSNMHDDAPKPVHPIWALPLALHIINCIEQPQLEWERHPVSEFDIFLDVFLELEPLQVEGEDGRESFNLHPKTRRVSEDTKIRLASTYRFSASCSPQQLSQKNLFFALSISDALNWRKHAVREECCSMSTERSRKDSERAETCSQSVKKCDRIARGGCEGSERSSRGDND